MGVLGVEEVLQEIWDLWVEIGILARGPGNKMLNCSEKGSVLLSPSRRFPACCRGNQHTCNARNVSQVRRADAHHRILIHEEV